MHGEKCAGEEDTQTRLYSEHSTASVKDKDGQPEVGWEGRREGLRNRQKPGQRRLCRPHQGICPYFKNYKKPLRDLRMQLIGSDLYFKTITYTPYSSQDID